MICPSCKMEVPDGAKICGHCRSKIPKPVGQGVIILAGLLVFVWIVGMFMETGPPNINLPPVAEIQTPTWKIEETQEKMGRGTIKTASIQSINQIQFDFPYQGPQRATLQLRSHPAHGNEILLHIERGQFLCGLEPCKLNIKFDDGRPQLFAGIEPSDNSTETLFIRNYDRFMSGLRPAKKLYIEATFYQEGTQVLEFNVDGLDW